MNQTSSSIASFLVAAGIDALALPATVRDSELDAGCRATLRFPFSHKMAATGDDLSVCGICVSVCPWGSQPESGAPKR